MRHRRFAPAEHFFNYRLFMMYLDLDELPHLFDPHRLWSPDRFNVAQFRRSDHIGNPHQNLKESARDLVEAHSGHRPDGSVRLLTHLRYFGYRFNPVSFYYCYSADESLEAIIAEINNTPWGEQHAYVLDEAHNEGRDTKKRYSLDKAFHISPFMCMEQHYTWHFTSPKDHLSVHMQSHEHGTAIFDATMNLQRTEINCSALTRVLMQYPLITARVTSAIYWQALRLWLKRIPFYSHPSPSKGSQ